jgi:putative DNA primase/helicase
MLPVLVDDPLQLAWYETNDFGNARRLVVLAKGRLKWVDDEYWVAFDGQRWSEREGTFYARSKAHEVAQHIHLEVRALAELIGDPQKPDAEALASRFGDWCTPALALDRLKALSAHAIKSGNANQTDAMLKQARDMEEMRAWSEDFDVDPLTYNVANGVLRFRQRPDGRWGVDWREGHDAADMLRQIARWSYDPKATCPMWEARLELVQPDPEVRAVLPRMYGQTLTGLTDCEEFYVHKGRGGDGKTKTHEILAHGHGDYYRHSAVSTWLKSTNQRGGAEHRRDLVALAGDYRFILSDEPGPGAMWDGELLKQWTGGGEITASDAGAKARDVTVFKPRGKLFVEVNPTPRMPSDDKGFRRRFRLVQWLVDLNLIEGGFEAPAQLRERLWSESSGVLNWLIAGCLDWLGDRRVPVPEREEEALADFWATGNPFGEWLDEECDLTDRDAETGSTILFTAYKSWMERNEIEEEVVKKWNSTRFGRELGQRQIVGKKDRRGNKVRRGIRLRASDPLLRGNDGGAADRPASPPPKAADDDFGGQAGRWADDDPLGDDA